MTESSAKSTDKFHSSNDETSATSEHPVLYFEGDTASSGLRTVSAPTISVLETAEIG